MRPSSMPNSERYDRGRCRRIERHAEIDRAAARRVDEPEIGRAAAAVGGIRGRVEAQLDRPEITLECNQLVSHRSAGHSELLRCRVERLGIELRDSVASAVPPIVAHRGAK
jgi:hypothetical protein